MERPSQRDEGSERHESHEFARIDWLPETSHATPGAAAGIRQESTVAQDLELLANLVSDVMVFGIERLEVRLEGVDFLECELGLRQRLDAAEHIERLPALLGFVHQSEGADAPHKKAEEHKMGRRWDSAEQWASMYRMKSKVCRFTPILDVGDK